MLSTNNRTVAAARDDRILCIERYATCKPLGYYARRPILILLVFKYYIFPSKETSRRGCVTVESCHTAGHGAIRLFERPTFHKFSCLRAVECSDQSQSKLKFLQHP